LAGKSRLAYRGFPGYRLEVWRLFCFFTASASLEPRALRAPAVPTSPWLAATGRVRSTARITSSANAHAASTQRSRARPARGETGHLSKTFSGWPGSPPEDFPAFSNFVRHQFCRCDRFRDSVYQPRCEIYHGGLEIDANESFHDQTKIFTYQGFQDYENSKKRLSQNKRRGFPAPQWRGAHSASQQKCAKLGYTIFNVTFVAISRYSERAERQASARAPPRRATA